MNLNPIQQQKLSYADFKQTLKVASVKSGDVLIIFSALFNMGLPILSDNEQGITKPNIARFYLDAIFDIIGDSGFIVLPALTYSFCKGEVFKPFSSLTDTNALANYCIEHGLGVRTLDPNFSYVLLTKHDLLLDDLRLESVKQQWTLTQLKQAKHNLVIAQNSPYLELRKLKFSNVSLDCDASSLVGYLLQKQAKYAMLGTAPFFTFTHNVEQLLKVPSRYFKKFTGKIDFEGHNNPAQDYFTENKNSALYSFNSYYFVRYLCKNTEPSTKCLPLVFSYIDNKHVFYPSINQSHIMVWELNYWFDIALKEFKKDYMFCCHGPALSEQEYATLPQDPHKVAEHEIDRKYYLVVDLQHKADRSLC